MIDVNSRVRSDASFGAFAESTIVRQMAEMVDASPDAASESASMLRDIADCLELLSQAWPLSGGSTNGSPCISQPGISEEFTASSEIERNDDRFEIRRLLGHGGFGVVLLAFDRRLGREVALKVPRPEILVSRDMRQRFLREAQAAAALDHPNIVPVYDTGDIGPTWFITSRYVAGPTLAEWLQRQDAPIDCRAACELIAMLSEAVHHAHSRGVLHRDIKPANVLLEPGDEAGNRALPFSPRLSDFGLARRLDDEDQFTRHGARVGTPRYMAPEQAAGRFNEVGIPTDVYGLGVMLYELLAGTPPHAHDSELETMRRILEEPAAVAPLRARGVPRDLQTICLKCLEKDQARRYETAGALAADLRRFLASEPVEARPLNVAGRLSRWCRRRPWQAALGAALCLVSILGVAGIAWQWLRAEQSLIVAKSETARAEANLRHLELAFVDLAWMFEEADVWTGSDELFPILLQGKLHRYAEEMFPQYLSNEQVPKPISAAFYAMTAKSQSLKGHPQAEDSYRTSIDLWRQVLQHNPGNNEHLRALAMTLSGYTAHLIGSGQVPTAARTLEATQEMFRRLELSASDEIVAREAYAHFLTNVGHSRARRAQHASALEAFDVARQMWHELALLSPNAYHRVMEATMLSAIAVRQHRINRDARAALAMCEQARKLIDEALLCEPQRRDFQLLLARALREEAYFNDRCQNPLGAVPIYRRALAMYEESFQSQPADPPQLEAFGEANLSLAALLRERQGFAAALPYYQQCEKTWTELLRNGTLSKENAERLAVIRLQVGNATSEVGDSAAAIAAFRSSIELAENLQSRPNPARKVTTTLIQSSLRLSQLLARTSELPAAVTHARKAVDLLKAQAKNRPDNLNFKQQLHDAEAQLRKLEAEIEAKPL